MKVILTLNGFLNTQLKYVGEVAGGIKPQINYGVADAESKQNKTTGVDVNYFSHIYFVLFTPQPSLINQNLKKKKKDYYLYSI